MSGTATGQATERRLLYRAHIKKGCCSILQHPKTGYLFKNLEYPLPYCKERETRLKVAEEMSVSAMT